ncbi:hypothetical protein S40293_03931 [Stachybotrys chartarum IBT 40293]|nr:hypothetical protein S40293_03931 [Stachybotrys chartarum IBT 40293]
MEDTTTPPTVGLVGLGINMYSPLCATSCHNILSRPQLNSSVPNEHGSHGGRHSPATGRAPEAFITPPYCYATDDSYLTSLAYCFDHYCGVEGDYVLTWELEKLWSENTAQGLMEPKWSYREALSHARETLGDDQPRVWNHGVMNYTAAANQTRYDIVYGSFDTSEHSETMHARHELIALVVGAGIPVILTLAQYLPFALTLSDKLAPYLSSSIYRDYNIRILPYWLGNALTVGESLYVFTYVVLNVVICFVDYRHQWPHRMYRSEYVEIMFNVADRTGIIEFAIAPLGVRWPDHPDTHAYAYFPKLSWRVWENHPFSVVRTSLIRRAQRGKPGEPTESTESSEVSSYSGKSSDSQAEKGVDVTVRPAGGPAPITTTTGLTLYVKKSKGMTKYFQQAEKLTTLIEGPYSDRSHDDLMLCDKLVCFGGGVGITGVLPLTAAHSNAKVYWNMKESDSALAADLTAVTDSLDESEVRVGQRFDVHDVLDMESSGRYEKIGVVVCGPCALCDDVRATVSRL